MLDQLSPHPKKYDNNDGLPEQKDRPEIPSVHPVTSEILRDCLEQSDEPIAGALINLFKKLQIQEARLRSEIHDIYSWAEDKTLYYPDVHNACERIIEATEIAALAASVFPYARGEKDEIPEESILERVSEMLLFDDAELKYPEVFDILRVKIAAAKSSQNPSPTSAPPRPAP